MSIWEETKEQRQKMKGKSLKEKWNYFWEYYKIHTLVIILGVSLVGSLTVN